MITFDLGRRFEEMSWIFLSLVNLKPGLAAGRARRYKLTEPLNDGATVRSGARFPFKSLLVILNLELNKYPASFP